MKQIFVLAFTLLSCAAAHAADPESLPRPNVEVGSRWQMQVLDGLTRVKQRERLLTVASVTADGIQIGDEAGQLAYLLDPVNLGVKAAGALQFDPAIERMQFPLVVGKRWEQAYTYLNPQCGKTQSKLIYTVIGWENVTVPAGTFRALKIEANGNWRSGCGSDRMVQAFWVTAEHGLPVKQEVQNYYSGRLHTFEVSELVSASKP